MNGNIARGRWQQFKGTVTAQWGQITGDRLRVMTGRHLQMVGGLDVAYGKAKDEVGRQIDGVHRRSRALYAKTSLQQIDRAATRSSSGPVSALRLRNGRMFDFAGLKIIRKPNEALSNG